MTKWHLAAWFSGIGCLIAGYLLWEFLQHRKRVAAIAVQVEEIHRRNASEVTRAMLHDESERTRSHITSVMDGGVRKDIEITKTRMDYIESLMKKIATFFGVKL
jgi:hypothetical protein